MTPQAPDETAERPRASRNRLLRALGRRDFERLRPHLRRVELASGHTLFEPDEPIRYVYFVESGVVSLVSLVEGGAAVEVASVGNEGMVGLPVVLGAVSSPGRSFVQFAGEALRVKAAVFRDELGQGGTLQGLLHRYTQALFTQIAQTAACNRSHGVEQRCARWLLATHDRAGEARFPVTHASLAQLLGVRRATVTLAAGALQRAGCIDYARGRVAVVDRAGLEASACVCYRIIRGEYERLLPPEPGVGRWPARAAPRPAAGSRALSPAPRRLAAGRP